MPDVSRVEYDAALKRVREARSWHDLNDLGCERLTLAALGLDEPPTEDAAPLADERARIIERLRKIEDGEYSVVEMAHDLERLARHPVWEASNKAAADAEAAYDRGRSEAVVPPSEPPKACPTCEGRGELKQPAGYPINCDECDGTGRTP